MIRSLDEVVTLYLSLQWLQGGDDFIRQRVRGLVEELYSETVGAGADFPYALCDSLVADLMLIDCHNSRFIVLETTTFDDPDSGERVKHSVNFESKRYREAVEAWEGLAPDLRARCQIRYCPDMSFLVM